MFQKKWFKLNDDLSQFTLSQLLGVCVVFSVISPLMHQIWYALDGDTLDFWPSLAVMTLGDLGGSVVLLGALYWLLKLIRLIRST